jgi:predicted small lipoprotein YifL
VHAWPSTLQLAPPTAAKLAGQAGCVLKGPPLVPDAEGLHAGTTKITQQARVRKLARVGPTSIPDLYQHPRAES